MRRFSLVQLLLGLLFVFAAALQFNDPDPVRWILLYAAAAAISFWAAVDRVPRWLPAGLAVIAAAWALVILPSARGASAAGVFATFEMKEPGVEEAREAGGLGIVAAWMAATAARRRTS